jgi:putative flippase GtrA
LAYLGLFWTLSGPLGGQGANAAALLLTAVANTAANRRFTFGVRGRTARARHQVQGIGVFAVGLGITSGALALLPVADAHPGRAAELAVLVAANLAATAARFALLRGWVFRPEVGGIK